MNDKGYSNWAFHDFDLILKSILFIFIPGLHNQFLSPLWSLKNMDFSCTELCYCSHQAPEHNCALLLHKKQKQQVLAFCHCYFTYFHLKCKLFFAWQRRCVCHSGEGKNMSWKSNRAHSAHQAVFLWAESHSWSADLRLAMGKKKKIT